MSAETAQAAIGNALTLFRVTVGTQFATEPDAVISSPIWAEVLALAETMTLFREYLPSEASGVGGDGEGPPRG